MNQENIRIIKKRAGFMYKLVKITFILGVILFLAVMLGSAFLIFASPEKFNAVKGNLDWSITYTLEKGSSFFINVPFKILQPLDSSRFSAKYAALTSLFSLLINLSLILFGIKQVSNILNSTSKDLTPFIRDNAKSLKKLACSIIIYSLASDILASLLFSIFVTHIFSINLSNIHLSGLLVGGLIYLIGEIFTYGIFLQNEFDTTL